MGGLINGMGGVKNGYTNKGRLNVDIQSPVMIKLSMSRFYY
jgi:hypothetical protein